MVSVGELGVSVGNWNSERSVSGYGRIGLRFFKRAENNRLCGGPTSWRLSRPYIGCGPTISCEVCTPVRPSRELRSNICLRKSLLYLLQLSRSLIFLIQLQNHTTHLLQVIKTRQLSSLSGLRLTWQQFLIIFYVFFIGATLEVRKYCLESYKNHDISQNASP